MLSTGTAERFSVTGASVSLRGICHAYNTGRHETLALSDVSLDIRPGEFVSVIGPSGCGKSTLLRIAGGLLEPDGGDVRIDGASPEEARLHKRLGYVFQDPALLPWLDVRANVRLGLDVNRRRSRTSVDVEALLAMVGLAQAAALRPHQLSGGMRQRVALARALALQPSLLLMDEPFAALDEITREAMRYELVRVCERQGASIVFVTHSIREAVILSDRVVVLTAGPGRIRADISIDLPRPRLNEIERLPAFFDYTERLRELLR